MKPRLTLVVHGWAVVVGLIPWMNAEILAQEAVNSESATQPSTGHFILKEQFRYFSLDNDPSPRDREVKELRALTFLNYGLSQDLSLSFRLPLAMRWQESKSLGINEQATGADDLTALAKWRIWKEDTGPIDTRRFSLIGGLEVRTGDSEFTSDSYDPIVGVVFTQIAGRHGFNFDALWEFTTDGDEYPLYVGEGQADAFHYDASYLYRLAPETYTEETSAGAWYAMIEMNGVYETNGDHEIFLSPGFMYEGRTWALEFSVQLPTVQELDHRPETEYAVVLGLRFFL